MLTTENVLRTYRNATPSQIADGRAWYPAANTFAAGLADSFGIPFVSAAGVVAALSPQLEWGKNMRYAEVFMATGDAPTLGLSKRKAGRIVAGESPDVVFAPADPKRKTGQKVRSFFACIVNLDRTDEVCIDRHACDVVLGEVYKDNKRDILKKRGMYEAFQEVYFEAAADLGEVPSVVQAVTWVAWKATKPYAHAQHRTLYQKAG